MRYDKTRTRLQVSISLYPLELDLLGADPATRIAQLTLEIADDLYVEGKLYDRAVNATARARSARQRTSPVSMYLPMETHKRLLRIGQGNLTRGVRAVIMHLQSEIPPPAARAWRTVTIRTGLYRDLTNHDPTISFAQWVETAFAMWAGLPDTLRKRLADQSVIDDTVMVDGEGSAAQFNIKLTAEQLETLGTIYGSLSQAVRQLLRTLIKLLEGRLRE